MRCIGENTETYKTFSVEFKKEEAEENEHDEEEVKTKKCRFKFIDIY